jgi:SAM-dependent methyltransferase
VRAVKAKPDCTEAPEQPMGGPRDCCTHPVDPRIARRFDEKAAAWADADDFPPLLEVSARFLDVMRDASLVRPSVLELGCGTGGLTLALLEMGAQRAHGVDLSASSIEVARRRAARAGYGAQATFVVGNAAEAPLEQHDWVVLDRVICCFGDADRLLGSAMRAARSRIAISLPESRGWRGLINRPLWMAENIWDIVSGGCRGYVHDVRRLERQLADEGFHPVRRRHSGLWALSVYERG